MVPFRFTHPRTPPSSRCRDDGLTTTNDGVGKRKVRATSAVFRFLKMLERLTYRAADHVAFLHEGMQKQAVGTFPPLARKSSVIPTFADTETLTPLPRDTTIRASLGLPADSFVVGYAGNIGAAQDLEVLIRAAAKLRENGNVAFVVAGDGHDRTSISPAICPTSRCPRSMPRSMCRSWRWAPE